MKACLSHSLLNQCCANFSNRG